MTVRDVAGEDIRIVDGKEVFQSLSSLAFRSKRVDCLLDAKGVGEFARMTDTLFKQLRARGINTKCVTEITSENLQLCKDLEKYVELLHTPRPAGNFFLFDKREFAAYIDAAGNRSRLLIASNPSFVDGQRFLFDTVLERALTARQRVIEIAKGTSGEFITTINDPAKIKALVIDLAMTASYEIAVLFSTTQAFFAAERQGILDALGKASERGAAVKILVMYDQSVKDLSDSKLRLPNYNVQVNYLIQFLPTKITTIIVDQAKCMTIEVNDDTKDTFEDAIGLATYSNSESTVFSNVSIFESLWIQSELDKQNKARQTYFKLFKGFKIKDEIYNRRWTVGQQEGAKEPGTD